MTIETSVRITCPACGAVHREEMATDSCQFYYECPACRVMIRPKEGDCCVYCSYGDRLCPPRQEGRTCEEAAVPSPDPEHGLPSAGGCSQ